MKGQEIKESVSTITRNFNSDMQPVNSDASSWMLAIAWMNI